MPSPRRSAVYSPDKIEPAAYGYAASLRTGAKLRASNDNQSPARRRSILAWAASGLLLIAAAALWRFGGL